MIKKVFTIILLSAAAAIAQTGFSVSKSYEPREKPKAIEDVKPIASSAQEVVIPVSVFDMKGMPVTDLTQANFSVIAGGVEQKVTSFEKASESPSIVLLLDMSPSAHFRIEKIREQAAAFVEALPAGAKVMIADFNSEMNIRTQLTSDRKEILRGISKTKVGDGTSLYSSIQTLFQKVLPLVPGRKVVVLFTDGVDTTSAKTSYANSLREIELGDVSVYTVFHDTYTEVMQPGTSIGPIGGGRFPLPPGVMLGRGRNMPGTYIKEYEFGREYLGDLGSATGGRVLSSDKFDGVIKQFVAELSTKYYVTIPILRTNAAPSSKPLKVRINRPDLIVLAKGSFIE
jgi:VWFA-related protein